MTRFDNFLTVAAFSKFKFEMSGGRFTELKNCEIEVKFSELVTIKINIKLKSILSRVKIILKTLKTLPASSGIAANSSCAKLSSKHVQFVAIAIDIQR